jgi:L-asparaginase
MALRTKHVLVLNTGGTIGMIHEDNNPLNPLKPGDWNTIAENYPVLDQLGRLNKVEVDMHSFTPLLDSSNITYQNWQQMAEVIKEKYDDYDGFVILHGTDTMCYTASALSFMLELLGKPVILTGSQLPLVKPRSDALENFVTSICIAAGVDVSEGSVLPIVPEVCIFFGGKLLRGNRSRKLSSSAYAGFESPNYPALGKAEAYIQIEENLVRALPKSEEEEFFVSTNLMTGVMALDIFPGIDPMILKRAVIGPNHSGKPIKGLVLKTFGAGNAPTDEKFLDAIGEIVSSGVIVVDVTQCPQGMVEIGLYEASVRLLDKGVISGLDMTPEAALCKLMWLFGKGFAHDQVVSSMQIDQRGEQSMNIFNVDYGSGKADPVFNGQKEVPGRVNWRGVVRATLRIQNAQFITEQHENKKIQLKVYVAHPSVDVTTPTDGVIQYAGKCEKTLADSKEKTTLFLDLARQVKRFYTPGQPGLLGVVTNEGNAIKWEKLNLALYETVKAKWEK